MEMRSGAPRVARECAHAGRPHRHGTRTAYVKDSCRCAACTAANAEAMAMLRRKAILRRPAMTSAEPARRHLQQLQAAGLGLGLIGQMANVSRSGLTAIARGRRQVYPATAARILAVPLDTRLWPSTVRVGSRGTLRRLQALASIGWSPGTLAREGLTRNTVRRLLVDSPATVTVGTAQKVDRLYRQLWSVPPNPINRVQADATESMRQHARLRGWVSALAWDDIDADEHPQGALPQPKARSTDEVDEIAIERARFGGLSLDRLTAAEQIRAVAAMSEDGLSLRDIAGILRTTPRTVSRRRQAVA